MAAIVAARGLQTGSQPQRQMPASQPEPAARTVPPTVKVRLFAALREAMGWSEQLVTPDPGTWTPQALWHQLGLKPATPPAGVRVAINQQFASWDALLNSGDELAFLPPISGG